jgi:hypothetical protein
MALRSIEKIVQLCGQNMKNDGWSVIILNIGKASEIGDQQYFMPGANKGEVSKLE